MCPPTAIRVRYVWQSLLRRIEPSIHPSTETCRFVTAPPKTALSRLIELGELPSTVEPYVYGRKCRFDEAFLVIPIVGRSG